MALAYSGAMLAPESLRCFLAAARLLNFRAASASVGLTPAALGQRVAQLEDTLGRPLFHRTTRAVALTEAGLALLPAAEAAMGALQTCLHVGRGEAGPAPCDVVLGTRYELGMSWVMPLLPRLRSAFPHITVHLYFGSGADLLARVRSQVIHAAIGSMRVDDPLITSARLHRESYVLTAAPALLAKNPFASREDARRHVLIDENARLPLFSYFRDASRGGPLEFASNVYMGTIGAIHHAVLAEEGVAVLPRYLIRRDLAAGRLVHLFPAIRLQHDYFRLFYRRDDPRLTTFEHIAARMLTVPLS